ncbi:MAG TPA: hypothetical protein VGH34_15185, partial [Vicinamibacterales bacterium]
MTLNLHATICSTAGLIVVSLTPPALAYRHAPLDASLSSGQSPAAANWTDKLMCAADKRAVDVNQPVVSSGFSVDRSQTRSLTAAQAGLRSG